MSKEKKDDNSTNNRWWESYLVRYLSGSIAGAFCIVIVILSLIDESLLNSKILVNSASNIDWKYFPLLGLIGLSIVAGLVYSYMISSPITVIHYGRGGPTGIEKHVRHMWLGWSWSLLSFPFFKDHLNYSITLNLICSIIAFSLKKFRTRKIVQESEKYKRIAKKYNTIEYSAASAAIILLICKAIEIEFHENHLKFLFLLGFPAIFVGLMQYVTLFRIFNQETLIHKFYGKLSKVRSKSGAKDIRETYSHLREHSNSTFIVLLEVCVTCFLLFIINISNYNSRNIFSSESKELASNFIIFFSFWLLPNLFMWSQANRLEKSFTQHPKKYLEKKEEKSQWSDC